MKFINRTTKDKFFFPYFFQACSMVYNIFISILCKLEWRILVCITFYMTLYHVDDCGWWQWLASYFFAFNVHYHTPLTWTIQFAITHIINELSSQIFSFCEYWFKKNTHTITHKCMLYCVFQNTEYNGKLIENSIENICNTCFYQY